jgi:hypothetical protein
MNGESKEKTFDEAAQEFEKTPATMKLLRPYTERIAELRSKGASYRFISDLLKHDNVTVSRMSVARFCYAVLKPRAGRKRNGTQQSAERIQEQSANHAPPAADSPQPLAEQLRVHHEAHGPWTPRKRGPRIADAKTL